MASTYVTLRKQRKSGSILFSEPDCSLILSMSDEEDALDMIKKATRAEELKPIEEDAEGQINPEEGPEENKKATRGTDDPLVDAILSQLDKRFEVLNKNLSSFKKSLEYSQEDIDDLKTENRTLRNRITQMELEEKRNETQLKTLEDRIDRIDTSTRRKNLVLEGIEETNNGKDNFQPLIFQLVKQVGIDRQVDYDTCHRVGPFKENKCRPIIVSFIRQSDRDEVYAKRAQMKKTADFHDVWLNEDLGPNSRRVNAIVRLVAKEAHKQGIDNRPTKYSIRINDKKYDEKNFDELPEPLSLHELKSVKIGKTIAYQSEHSKFSNFYPREFKVGTHKYLSVEQAYHHIRARSHQKYVVALKILLCRIPQDIKALGREFESNEEWEEKKLDVMLMCMKSKFEQCSDLAEVLMETKGFRLVEATPDFFWAAGATLSSNVLRRGQWKGRNEQGKLLELVRDMLLEKHTTDSTTNNSSGPKQADAEAKSE